MVCLVTGSSRGLGKAVALAFGKRGHQVVIHYNERKDEAEQVSLQIKNSLVCQADVKSAEGARSLIAYVIDKWDRIDVIVNNAGITREGLMIKMSEKDYDDVINTNLKGPYNVIRTAAEYMTRQKSGHIINVSSIAGLKGREGLSAYSSSKAGLIGLTRSAAAELCKYKIMVNAVLPGFILTDMGVASSDTAKEIALKDSLLNDFSGAAHVAEFICYLSGTSGISGQVFNLDSRII